jgi:eukaryotic-like serine/threonine-protein kinase
MTRERWQQLEAVLDRSLELTPAERAAYLQEACAGDAELRSEVEALLSADDEAGAFLSKSAGEVAAGLMEEAFAEAPNAAPPPEQIGPYRIEERLGRGGMGEVYRAFDSRLHRLVALKRVRAAAGDVELARHRFQREARAMAQLSHSAVVQVHDWVAGEGEDWIVMELVDGRPLRELLAAGPLAPAEAIRIGRGIAAGLAAAHGAGLVHRDLKLDNVMVTPAGEVKILDFGIARQLLGEPGPGEDPATLARLTLTGKVVGTVTAMSPEQAMGLAVDHRSDLFSLGSLLYELLTGESPFRGRNAMETLSRICSLRQPPVIKLRPEVPAALSDLVERLLAKDPAQRPASAEAVIAILDRVAADLPAERTTAREGPPAIGPGESAVKQDRGFLRLLRRRWKLALAAAAVLIAGVLVLQPGIRRAVRARLPAAKPATQAEPSTPYEHYQQGMGRLERFYRPGQVDQAIESFKAARALDERYAPAYAGLAQAYWRKYRAEKDPTYLEQARGNAEYALELDRRLTAASVSLALIRLAQGDREAASQELDNVLKLDPDNADAHRGLGDLYATGGDPARAEQEYRKAAELRPGDLDLHSQLGGLYFHLGRYGEAETVYQHVITLDPTEYSSYKNLAAVYHMQGRYADAARALQKALERKADPRVYNNLGILYLYQGLYPQALDALKEAVRLGPNDYQARGNLGDAYHWTPGKADEADEAYRTAIHLLEEEIKKAPKNPTLQAQLASYRAKRKDREGALRELRALDSLEGKTADTFFYATLAAEIAGARDLALANLGLALATGYSLDELRKEPWLIALRKDPRFQELVAKAEEDSARPATERSQ